MLLPLVGGLGLVGNLASVVVLRLELATNLREVLLALVCAFNKEKALD